MARPQAVIDASVAVKWFLKEEHSEKALLLRDDYTHGDLDLIAPDLLPYEVLNALKNKPGYAEAKLVAAAQTLHDIGLPLIAFANISAQTVRIAVRYSVTVYDASYLALGEVLGAAVYTSDERMLGKVDDPRLRHIRDYTG